jgi:DNA-binding CsgD family transcriptional regulator
MTGSRELLEAVPRHDTAHAALLTDILDIMHGSSPTARGESSPPLAEELSPGELRVLRYLPGNLSRVEIASELSVSLNTVNTHIRSIYAKLVSVTAPRPCGAPAPCGCSGPAAGGSRGHPVLRHGMSWQRPGDQQQRFTPSALEAEGEVIPRSVREKDFELSERTVVLQSEYGNAQAGGEPRRA